MHEMTRLEYFTQSEFIHKKQILNYLCNSILYAIYNLISL